jgi:hypothetical protein
VFCPQYSFRFRAPLIRQDKACFTGDGCSIAKEHNAVMPYERRSLRACPDGSSPSLYSLELARPVLRSRALAKLPARHAETQDMLRTEH